MRYVGPREGARLGLFKNKVGQELAGGRLGWSEVPIKGMIKGRQAMGQAALLASCSTSRGSSGGFVQAALLASGGGAAVGSL
jgi:hypothetical protein